MGKTIVSWIEPSIALLLVMVFAISTSAVSLYRIDSIEAKVDKLVEAIGTISVIQTEVTNLKERDKEIQRVFESFANSVDRLAVAVAKLDGELNASKR